MELLQLVGVQPHMTTPLGVIRLDLPCQVPWDQMRGDDRVRFCTQCNLNVHNLSAMSEDEAAAFLAMRDGRVCVAYERREDGSAVFADRPTTSRRSLPVMPYATPTRRPRWLVPAAIAGALATAGATAALRPTATKAIATTTGGGGSTRMVAGGIGPPPAVAFDPRNPTVACQPQVSDVKYVLTHDELAQALVEALPAGLELIDVRYSVYPVGGTKEWGQAYVVGTPDQKDIHAVIWMLSSGSTFPNAANGESITAVPSTRNSGRTLFLDCDDAELSNCLAHAMAGPG